MLKTAAAFLWTAWSKFHTFTPPAPWLLSATGLGALAVNLGCAYLLAMLMFSGILLRPAQSLSGAPSALT